MAVEMKKEDQDALAAAGAAWNNATTQAEKDAAHAQAEAIRAKYNYSGGADGSQYIPTTTTTSKSNTSGNSQYTAVGKGSDYYAGQQMSASDQALLKSYGDAYNNATTDAERQAAHAAAEALRAQYGYSGGGDGSEYIQIIQPENAGFTYGSAPTYTDQYSQRIDEMLNQILNRDAFSYNAAEDDLYQQYRDQYTREGQRAMQDTLGQVAARTGGMASSYAVSAAQQQNNYYMQQLSDKIPELYQLAYQMYLDDIDLQVQDLGLLQGASDTAYNRYRDTMADWRDDRDFAYGMYRDDIGDSQWQSSFDRDVFESDRDYNYGVGRDAIEDSRYTEKWEYQLAQDALAQQNWEAEQKAKADAKVSPVEPDDSIEPDEPVEPDDIDEPDDEDDDGGLTNADWNNVVELGLAPNNAAAVADLIQYGGLVERDGKLVWADGWTKDNYATRLDMLKNGVTLDISNIPAYQTSFYKK